MNYFEQIPSELNNIIVSYLYVNELDALFKTFKIRVNDFEPKGSKSERQIAVPILNWGVIHEYRFGKYKNVSSSEYVNKIRAEMLIHQFYLPYTIDELLDIKFLDLSKKDIIEVYTEIFILNKLIGLDLSHNKIMQIPMELLVWLHNLERLDLSYNKITFIPTKISDLHNLKNLDLSHNKIQIIPKQLGNLLNLQQLDLSHNKIKEIPIEMSNLTNLEELGLARNQIEYVPKELSKLLNLHDLDLSNNPIDTIPKEIIKMHVNLEINNNK